MTALYTYYSKNGANINLRDKIGYSPLHAACNNKNVSIVQLILSNGADIDSGDENGISLLNTAFHNKKDSTVHLLIPKWSKHYFMPGWSESSS